MVEGMAMSLRLKRGLCLAMGLAALTALPDVRAELIVDDFTGYSAGPLIGQTSPVAGFAGSWTGTTGGGTGSVTVSAGELSMVTGEYSPGASVQHGLAANSLLADDGDAVWASIDFSLSDGIGDIATAGVAFGLGSPGTAWSFGIESDRYHAGSAMSAFSASGSDFLLVSSLTRQGNDGIVRLWVNPVDASGPALMTSYVTHFDPAVNSFLSEVRITYGDNTMSDADGMTVRSIQIGGSFNEILGLEESSPASMPGGLSLMLLGLLVPALKRALSGW